MTPTITPDPKIIQGLTVVVAGAGASVDYGYPTGAELRDQLVSGLMRPVAFGGIRDVLIQSGHVEPDIDAFRKAFAISPHPSIDLFIEHRFEFERIGKHAIAAALLRNEDPEMLIRKGMTPRWYDLLWDAVIGPTGVPREHHVGIITFNYDRSLEQYLGAGLGAAYGIERGAIEARLTRLPIIHVHGSLGRLPFTSGQRWWRYGSVDWAKHVTDAARQIRVLVSDDDARNDEQFLRARDLLTMAQNVCFLGFGYGATNIARLGFTKAFWHGGRHPRGTSHGLTERERVEAVKRLGLSGSAQASFPPVDCTDLVRGHGIFDPQT